MIYAVAGGCVLQPPGLTVSRNDRMAKKDTISGSC